VNMFQSQGVSATSGALRTFAQANLPALQGHLQMAQRLQANMP
jgi:hypothetical protein